MSYAEWKDIPDSLEKAAIAALVYLKPGEYGPWPVNISRERIVEMLSRWLPTHDSPTSP